MARFRWLGGKARPGFIKKRGQLRKIRIPLQDGTKLKLEAPNKQLGFVEGEDLGVEITDPRALRLLRNDNRFEEIA